MPSVFRSFEGDTATTTKSADNKSIESLNREVCRWCRFSRSVRPSRKWFYVNAINLRKRKIPSQIEISRESRAERRRPFSAKSHTGHKTPKWEKEREWGGKTGNLEKKSPSPWDACWFQALKSSLLLSLNLLILWIDVMEIVCTAIIRQTGGWIQHESCLFLSSQACCCQKTRFLFGQESQT